jgi:beta-glucanase (GH16 family)
VIKVRIVNRTAPLTQAPSAAPPPFPFSLTSGLLSGLTAPTTSSPTTSSSVPGAPSDACGAQPQKADGTWWTCTFDAEFSTTELNRSKWMPATAFTMGSPDAHACYLDSPQNISVSGGALHLTVRKVTTPVTCSYQSVPTPSSYTSGSVMTYRLFSQQYGRFEARMRTTSTSWPGLQETFWLWPDDRVASSVLWPAAGEIDIAETYSQYPTLAIPFLHYTANDNGGPIPGLNTAWNCGARRGLYNTYTLEWSPTTLKIIVNGTTCLVNNSADPAFRKPYIISLTAGLGQGANALTANTPLPATLDVDYVRVWK